MQNRRAIQRQVSSDYVEPMVYFILHIEKLREEDSRSSVPNLQREWFVCLRSLFVTIPFVLRALSGVHI